MKLTGLYGKGAYMQFRVCGFLFSIFSIVYLYVFQKHVLEALHFSLAHGKTHFAPLGSALVITLILVLLAWGISSLFQLKEGVKAWAYFPSCVILGFLTRIDYTVYLHHTPDNWMWQIGLLLVGVVVVTMILRYVMRPLTEKQWSLIVKLNSNLSILLVLCFMTILIGNTKRIFHHELEAEFYLRERNTTKVLKVAEKSVEASRTLTVLRSIAMACEGSMGDKLFAYPQYYKSDGLFFPDKSAQNLRFNNDSIYALLGVRPYVGEKRQDYLRNSCYEETGKYTALDYYLSSLLLEKQLDDFVQAFDDLCDSSAYIPRYYQEAFILYEDACTSAERIYSPDSVLLSKYVAYKERKTTFTSHIEAKNQMRREYGDTYWWYFDYQE